MYPWVKWVNVAQKIYCSHKKPCFTKANLICTWLNNFYETKIERAFFT